MLQYDTMRAKVSGDTVYLVAGVSVQVSGAVVNVSGSTVYFVNNGINNVIQISGQAVYFADNGVNNVIKISGSVIYEVGATPKAGAGVVITAASGGTQLPNISGFSFLIRSISGNATMMVGTQTNPPDVIGISGIGMPIYGADAITLKVTNLNTVRVLASVSGQVIAYLAVDR